MKLTGLRSHITKENLIYTLLVVFCLLEARQFMDLPFPHLFTEANDLAANYQPVLRADLLCARNALLAHNAGSFYFVDDQGLGVITQNFASIYASYLFEPNITASYDPNSTFALAVIQPGKLDQFLALNQYTLIKQCGHNGVIVLRHK